MYKQALLLAAIAALPLSSHAQSYIGLGATMLTDAPFSSSSTSSPALYGGTLTGGLQLTPHTALQLEVGYNGRTITTSTSNSPAYTSTYESRSRVLLVPLLLRYTVTDPEKSFHFDGLAGFTFFHNSIHYSDTYTYQGQTMHDEGDGSTTRFCASLGPSVRYALTPQVELAAAGVVNAVLNDNFNNFSDRLFLNAQLGVHYVFGQR